MTAPGLACWPLIVRCLTCLVLQEHASELWIKLLEAGTFLPSSADGQHKAQDSLARAVQTVVSSCLAASARHSLSVWGMRMLLSAWALCQVSRRPAGA